MDESDSKRIPPSPAPTCVSMKSDTSKDQIIFFEGGGSSSPQQMEESVSKRKPPSPALSCESMKSDMSKDQIIFFEGEGRSTPQQMEESVSKRKAPSPAPTCESMKSDMSKDQIIFFEGEGRSTLQQMEESVSKRKPPSPALSCESMKSDMSKDQIIFFEGEGRSTPQQMEESVSERKPPSPAPTGVSMKSDMSKDQIIFFEGGGRSSPQPSGLQKRSYSAVVKKQQAVHSQPDGLQSPDFKKRSYSAVVKKQQGGHSQPDGLQSPDFQKRSYSAVVKKQQGGTELSSLVVTAERWTLEEMQQIHKAQLQRKFQCLVEGSLDQGNCTSFNEVYTDLYIIEGGRVVLNEEHEVRQIERASWRKVDKPIKFNDIFKLGSGQDTPIRSVLTNGVAGIGKTVSVQKLILDWAEGKNNQHVNFIFPLPFRELNLMKERKFSLVGLIQHFFPKIKAEEIFTNSEHRLMFICDGLDECRLPLQFNQSSTCCDVTEQVSVDVLLTNLIQGNLLPSALLWITTRPAAASQIPQKYVSQVTEIRGFNNPQKEEYFGKRISDENLASRIIRHLKSSRSLYIMCHIPVFSCIAATVVERTSEESEKADRPMPRTLTQMYIQFLIIQTSMKKYKYSHREDTEEEIIVKLGKLAFQQLGKGNLIFYEEDLQEAGIDVTEASVYSGLCTQIFREERDVYQGRVFSFVHLTIQEFLAALYVFLCFSNREGNQQEKFQLSTLLSASTLHDLHKTAVDLALQSKNGHLDLFLRFLLGLSLESNQNLLKHLLPQTSHQSQSSDGAH
ncbi:protein NLRC3-like [Engraulis encrasicolus]|uniref:protein NLRC3-like n=1 Tax=Engraulis encrasicolus TaxID=184585 RepID=UPI002FD1F173